MTTWDPPFSWLAQLGVLWLRGTQIAGASSPEWLNFVLLCLILVGPNYAACFLSPFWRLEKLCTSAVTVIYLHIMGFKWFSPHSKHTYTVFSRVLQVIRPMCLNSKLWASPKYVSSTCVNEFTAVSEAVTPVLYCIKFNVYNWSLNWMFYYSDNSFNSKNCRSTKAC